MSGASHVEILERRVVILEDTIQMLSYNLRCLNIRQGSQPIELPDIDCEDTLDKETINRMVRAAEVILKCTPDDFENMVDTLVINEDRRYQDMVNFGADENAWAK